VADDHDEKVGEKKQIRLFESFLKNELDSIQHSFTSKMLNDTSHICKDIHDNDLIKSERGSNISIIGIVHTEDNIISKNILKTKKKEKAKKEINISPSTNKENKKGIDSLSIIQSASIKKILTATKMKFKEKIFHKITTPAAFGQIQAIKNHNESKSHKKSIHNIQQLNNMSTMNTLTTTINTNLNTLSSNLKSNSIQKSRQTQTPKQGSNKNNLIFNEKSQFERINTQEPLKTDISKKSLVKNSSKKNIDGRGHGNPASSKKELSTTNDSKMLALNKNKNNELKITLSLNIDKTISSNTQMVKNTSQKYILSTSKKENLLSEQINGTRNYFI